MEMPGIEPGAFHMQSERSTAELQTHMEINFIHIAFNMVARSMAARVAAATGKCFSWWSVFIPGNGAFWPILT